MSRHPAWRTIRPVHAWVHVLALSCLVTSNATAQTAFTPLEYERLVFEQRARIKSMQGSFSHSTVPDILAEKSQLMRGVVASRALAFAWSGEKRWREESSEWVAQNGQPSKSETTNMFDGRTFRRRYGKNFHIQRVKSSYAESNEYLNSLKWPFTESALEEIRTDPINSQYLPYFLKGPDWHVRRELETIQGVSCVVLDNLHGTRRLWLDPNRGFCMLRIEHGHPAKGFKQWVNEFSNFREILRGLYLPMRVVSQNICQDDKGVTSGTLTTTLIVDRLSVNDVRDDRFVLDPKSGDFVFDQSQGLMYTFRPKDNATLDMAIADAAGNYTYQERHAVTRRVLFFTIALVLGFLSVYLILRFRRRAT